MVTQSLAPLENKAGGEGSAAAGSGQLEPGEVAAVEALAEILGFNPRGMFHTVNGRPEVTYRGKLAVDAIWEKATRGAK